MRFVPARLALLACLTTSGCLAPRGPSLPATLPLPAPPLVTAEPTAVAAQPHYGLPGAGPAPRRLPRAAMDAHGTVRALVVPLGLGAQLPTWSDTAIAYYGVGAATGVSPHGAAALLYEASGGRFRLEATVLPHLMAPHASPSLAHPDFVGGPAMRVLVRQVLTEWAGRANLGGFDNDGPDGRALSADDDGDLDLVVLVAETDGTPTVTRVPLDLEVPAGRTGQLTRKIPAAFIVTLPVGTPTQAAATGFVTMTLRALGIDADEVRSAGSTVGIPTLARLRLGWLSSQLVTRSGLYAIPEGPAIAIPLVDQLPGTGFVVIERTKRGALLTTASRDPQGVLRATEVGLLAATDAPRIIPLTSARRTAGPRVCLAWQSGRGGQRVLDAHVLLSELAPSWRDPDEPVPPCATAGRPGPEAPGPALRPAASLDAPVRPAAAPR